MKSCKGKKGREEKWRDWCAIIALNKKEKKVKINTYLNCNVT